MNKIIKKIRIMLGIKKTKKQNGLEERRIELKNRVEKLGFKKTAVAKEIGCSSGYIYYMLSNKPDVTRKKSKKKLNKFLKRAEKFVSQFE